MMVRLREPELRPFRREWVEKVVRREAAVLAYTAAASFEMLRLGKEQ
jgi:hypothetical protein